MVAFYEGGETFETVGLCAVWCWFLGLRHYDGVNCLWLLNFLLD